MQCRVPFDDDMFRFSCMCVVFAAGQSFLKLVRNQDGMEAKKVGRQAGGSFFRGG